MEGWKKTIISQYFQKIASLLALCEHDEKENLSKAAEKIAVSIQQHGIIHLFGCGHSHMFGEELFYRAGGLAPISPILEEDFMLHKGAVRSSELERTYGIAEHFMETYTILPEDVMIVVSTSGRNPVPIEVAQIAKKKGAYVIVITSPSYAKTQSSRHPSGLFLYQTADLAIDNHIETGDALMRKEALNIHFGSGSTIIGMALLNGIMVEALEIMVNNHFTPPIFKSGNVDGAEEHNRKLIDQYKGRIPMLEA